MDRPVVLIVTQRPEAWLRAEEALSARFDFLYLAPATPLLPATSYVGFLIIDKNAGALTAGIMDELLVTYSPSATIVIGHDTMPADVFSLLLPESVEASIERRSSNEPAKAPSFLSRLWSDVKPGARSDIRLCGNLLGPLQVTFANAKVSRWPQQKARSIFAYLLHHHHKAVPRESLMQLFWPYVDLDSARNSLNVALHAIRRTFKPLGSSSSIIQHQQGKYQLSPDIELSLDTESFMQLSDEGMRREQRGLREEAIPFYEQALAIYRGPFMEDETSDWPARDRAMMAEREILLLDRLSRHKAITRQHIDTIAFCEKIIQKDPFREDAHRRLIRALYLDGQREKALRNYQHCEEMLRRQFQIEVAKETQELIDAIKKDDFQAVLDGSLSF